MQSGNYVFEMDKIFRYVLEMVGDGADAEYKPSSVAGGFYGGPLRTLLPFHDPNGCCSERFVKWSNCGRNTDKDPGYTCMEDMDAANTIVDGIADCHKKTHLLSRSPNLDTISYSIAHPPPRSHPLAPLPLRSLTLEHD